MQQHSFDVNGSRVTVDIEPSDTLSFVLRERLGLTGTKESCNRGECGACTVLIEGEPRMGCIELACRIDDVWTIEGLVDESESFRAAMARTGGFQCGFCTPGQVVMATYLQRTGVPDTDEDLREAISGNVCRCTGYDAIVASYRDVSAASAPDTAEVQP